MADKEGIESGWAAVSPALGPIPAIYVPPSPAPAERRDRHASIGGTMTDIPVELAYSQDHMWVRLDADTGLVRIGVTDFAQQSLGDVVAVTLPAPGGKVAAGKPSGDIKSVKSVNDLVTPVTGAVRARNEDLADAPDLVNTDPYGQGWMLEIDTGAAPLGQQLAALIDAAAYRELTGP
jgi:glycine cleavage system H protein